MSMSHTTQEGGLIMFIKASEKGQSLVLIAFAAIALFAFAALAIDGSAIFSDRRHAQNAADTAALDAALGVEHQIESGESALGVMAPPTAEWTAFEKNRGANAVAIVNREASNVEDESGGFLR